LVHEGWLSASDVISSRDESSRSILAALLQIALHRRPARRIRRSDVLPEAKLLIGSNGGQTLILCLEHSARRTRELVTEGLQHCQAEQVAEAVSQMAVLHRHPMEIAGAWITIGHKTNRSGANNFRRGEAAGNVLQQESLLDCLVLNKGLADTGPCGGRCQPQEDGLLTTTMPEAKNN
jgi:hypothetical protein